MIKARLWMAVITIAALISAPLSFAADDKIGIFETVHVSSVSFAETIAALETAFSQSPLLLHSAHDVRVPEGKHQAKVDVLTSPEYLGAAGGESPRTISAQVLRLVVYTQGDDHKTHINIANPVAHAMVFYADSPNYDVLVAAARNAVAEIRELVANVPGNALSEQRKPLRKEKPRKFKGDGPARMMAKLRTFKKDQLLIREGDADEFDAIVDEAVAAIDGSSVSDASDSTGWEKVARIKLRDNGVYVGLTNPYIEDRMISINSRFRKDGRSDLSPYPGVDRVTALPTEVLIVREAGKTRVLHYGQMRRMQLYFWDSGYRAFTANVGVPGKIAKSIEDTIEAQD